jgi:polar amino acid transport system substrate-binding protein
MTSLKERLAPTGPLRIGINMGNNLLVTDKTSTGGPIGVAADLSSAIAEELGLEPLHIPYPNPGQVADALAEGAWDIALIADEPARAETIAFTKAYVEIEATYLVREDSPYRRCEELDAPGIRIATSARSAYELYLTRSLKQAELFRGERMTGALELFEGEKMDALAGLRSALTGIAGGTPGLRVLEDRFTTVQQAVGTRPGDPEAMAFLEDFLERAKASGLVQKLIDKHGVGDRLQVAG